MHSNSTLRKVNYLGVLDVVVFHYVVSRMRKLGKNGQLRQLKLLQQYTQRFNILIDVLIVSHFLNNNA